MAEHTLYGIPLSLYTGKARSYLIKSRLPYREVSPASPHFAEHVLPKAGTFTIPTVVTADDEVIRDSTAILDSFEALAGDPASPTTPRQRILSRLFDVIGMEGLLRPAMHYRWSFPAENHAFLAHQFATLIPPDRDPTRSAEKAMGRMQQAAMAFGVVPDQGSAIEARYHRVMMALDAHFARWPYLFGARPSIGDYGLIAPLYGHLGRDPKPLAMMQAEAIHLFRWVERMNRPEPDVGEFAATDPAVLEGGFAPDDAVPETLVAVLRALAVDFAPETVAAAAFIGDWLAGQESLAPGTPTERGVGMARFTLEGASVSALAQPYRFYLLQRVHDDFDAMTSADRAAVESLFSACDLLPVLDARLPRRIGRADNREVWLEA